MAFGIGINNENQDAGMIRGSQQDIACECWFTQKGKIIPRWCQEGLRSFCGAGDGVVFS